MGTTLDKNSQSPVYVAVIDDEIDLVHLFKDALSQIDGIEVFAFSDPNLALEHFPYIKTSNSVPTKSKII